MDIEKVKRYSLIEVALLAMFTVGLLTAHLIVKHRATVVLSDLISLPGSGLSVSVPAGPGWERTATWQYEESESSMTLLGQFRPSSRGTMGVRWRYVFSTPDGSERELLEQRAQKISADIQSFHTIGQECPMVYARMPLRSSPQEEVYMGILRLGSNRSVELLVRSYGIGGFHGENVLKSVASSIQYRPGQEAADGHVLIEQFLKTQGDRLSRRSRPDEAFLIKDAAGKNQGYYYARHSVSNERHQALRTQIRQFEYNVQELKSELWFDPLEKDYRWKTDLSIPRTEGSLVYEIAPDESGGVLVTRNAKEVKTFPAGQFFLPEPLLAQLAHVFLESQYNSVIVDVLNARGQLLPVRLTKVPPAEANAKAEAVESVVRMDFIYLPDSYVELLFDRSQNLLGKFEQQLGRRGRIWDVVFAEVLQQIFQEDFQASDDGNATVSVAR